MAGSCEMSGSFILFPVRSVSGIGDTSSDFHPPRALQSRDHKAQAEHQVPALQPISVSWVAGKCNLTLPSVLGSLCIALRQPVMIS
jgi:hypothetical protein